MTGGLLAVCATLFLAVGITGYSWIRTPVSYISIDVNPSIEMSLNRWDRVVSVEAYNKEGTEVLKEVSVEGQTYKEAIDAIMDCSAMSSYLEQGKEPIFTVAATEGTKEELRQGVERCAGNHGHGGKSVSADAGLAEEAHQKGFSVGKYRAYLELKEYDDTLTEGECHKMSVSDMQDRIDSCEGRGQRNRRSRGHHE